MHKNSKVLILGDGNFGMCLAIHLARNNQSSTLWTRSEDRADHIKTHHKNPKYLTHIHLSPLIHVSCEPLSSILMRYDTIIVALPTQAIRNAIENVESPNKNTLIIMAAKGIELGTTKFPYEIIEEIWSLKDNQVILSGPSFAEEVALGLPSAVSAACWDHPEALSFALKTQNLFHHPLFRVYTGLDPIGLEVAGAFKNVIAIATGACEGLKLGANSRAALITRGLAEITRIGVNLGAKPMTFLGLGGVGDLLLTCTSAQSRNYRVGLELSKGKKLKQILEEMGSIAEGVTTAKPAIELIKKLKVDAPISTLVHQVLYDDMPIEVAMKELIHRDAKAE